MNKTNKSILIFLLCLLSTGQPTPPEPARSRISTHSRPISETIISGAYFFVPDEDPREESASLIAPPAQIAQPAEDKPDQVDSESLSENGRLAYRTYLKLWETEGKWRRSGKFETRDFVALVLAIELFPLQRTTDYYPAWTEALSRSYIEWRRYSPNIATDPETPEGLLNWIFAQSGTGRLSPQAFQKEFLGNEFLRQQAYRSLELIVHPKPDWLPGCEQISRPCFVGSNSPTLQLDYIDQFYRNGCQAYVFYGVCGEPDESNFSFILTRAQSLEYGR